MCIKFIFVLVLCLKPITYTLTLQSIKTVGQSFLITRPLGHFCSTKIKKELGRYYTLCTVIKNN